MLRKVVLVTIISALASSVSAQEVRSVIVTAKIGNADLKGIVCTFATANGALSVKTPGKISLPVTRDGAIDAQTMSCSKYKGQKVSTTLFPGRKGAETFAIHVRYGSDRWEFMYGMKNKRICYMSLNNEQYTVNGCPK